MYVYTKQTSYKQNNTHNFFLVVVLQIKSNDLYFVTHHQKKSGNFPKVCTYIHMYMVDICTYIRVIENLVVINFPITDS